MTLKSAYLVVHITTMSAECWHRCKYNTDTLRSCIIQFGHNNDMSLGLGLSVMTHVMSICHWHAGRMTLNGDSEKQEFVIAAVLGISGKQIMNVHSSTHTCHTQTPHTCMHIHHTCKQHTTQITHSPTYHTLWGFKLTQLFSVSKHMSTRSNAFTHLQICRST